MAYIDHNKAIDFRIFLFIETAVRERHAGQGSVAILCPVLTLIPLPKMTRGLEYFVEMISICARWR